MGGADFGGRIKSSIWDVLSLRCLLDKQLWRLNTQIEKSRVQGRA